MRGARAQTGNANAGTLVYYNYDYDDNIKIIDDIENDDIDENDTVGKIDDS